VKLLEEHRRETIVKRYLRTSRHWQAIARTWEPAPFSSFSNAFIGEAADLNLFYNWISFNFRHHKQTDLTYKHCLYVKSVAPCRNSKCYALPATVSNLERVAPLFRIVIILGTRHHKTGVNLLVTVYVSLACFFNDFFEVAVVDIFKCIVLIAIAPESNSVIKTYIPQLALDPECVLSSEI